MEINDRVSREILKSMAPLDEVYIIHFESLKEQKAQQRRTKGAKSWKTTNEALLLPKRAKVLFDLR